MYFFKFYMCDTFMLVELSYDAFTFFTDDILFSMLQNYYCTHNMFMIL
jgi:hypothetical protein